MADSDTRSTSLKSAFGAGALMAIAVILAIILVVIRLPAISAVYQAHWQRPVISKTPVPLQDSSAATAKGTSISAFGWNFEAPWSGIATSRKTSLAEITVFENGKSIGCFDPSKSVDTVAGFEQSLKDRGSRARLEAELGKDTTSSDYGLEFATLQVTPQDFSMFMSNKRARRDATLLFFKHLSTLNADTGLFSFSFENLHGFQFGDPARARFVVIHGFDWQDHAVQISVSMGDGKQDHVLQSEINRVIQTLHKINAAKSP